MRYTFIFFLFFDTMRVLSQIGVNTDSPATNTLFHVDPKRDTSSGGVSDDFVVTVDGMMGLGTTNPKSTLDVRGKMRIATGVGNNNLYLFSDANGFGTWKNIAYSLNTVSGQVNNNMTLYGRPPEAPTSSNVLNATIKALTLTKGRWLVFGRASVLNSVIPDYGSSIQFYDTTSSSVVNYVNVGAQAAFPQLTTPSFSLPFAITVVEVTTNTPMTVSMFVSASPVGKSSTTSQYGGSQFFALKVSEL